MKLEKTMLVGMLLMALTACGGDDDDKKGVDIDTGDTDTYQGSRYSKFNYNATNSNKSIEWIGLDSKKAEAIAAEKYYPITNPETTFLTSHDTKHLYKGDDMDNEDMDFSKYKDNPKKMDKLVPVGLGDSFDAILDGLKDASVKMRILNMPYSMVVGASLEKEKLAFLNTSDFTSDFGGGPDKFRVYSVSGLNTPEEFVDNLISKKKQFTYYGAAFTNKNRGELKYTIDFGKRTGEGEITGLVKFGDEDTEISDSRIELKEGKLKMSKDVEPISKDKDTKVYVIEGKTDLPLSNKYVLGVYGANAEEIAGGILDGRKDKFIEHPVIKNSKSNAVIGLGGTVAQSTLYRNKIKGK